MASDRRLAASTCARASRVRARSRAFGGSAPSMHGRYPLALRWHHAGRRPHQAMHDRETRPVVARMSGCAQEPFGQRHRAAQVKFESEARVSSNAWASASWNNRGCEDLVGRSSPAHCMLMLAAIALALRCQPFRHILERQSSQPAKPMIALSKPKAKVVRARIRGRLA